SGRAEATVAGALRPELGGSRGSGHAGLQDREADGGLCLLQRYPAAKAEGGTTQWAGGRRSHGARSRRRRRLHRQARRCRRAEQDPDPGQAETERTGNPGDHQQRDQGENERTTCGPTEQGLAEPPPGGLTTLQPGCDHGGHGQRRGPRERASERAQLGAQLVVGHRAEALVYSAVSVGSFRHWTASPKLVRSRLIARERRDLTVPRGTPSASAISASLSSKK